jgi:hypothetical protein
MEFKNIGEKELVISLIRDCLISFKLISGLNALGLDADHFTPFLGDAIFLLMGFKNHKHSDLIFENIFLANAEKVRSINFSSSTEDLDVLSKEIYEALLFAKGICDETQANIGK